MKKKFFYGALAVLSLAACSQEEVLDVNRNGDEIKFSVVTNKATRAVALYDNNTLPDQMNVWANMTADGTVYFSDDVVSRNGNSWTSANTRYWPDGNLDFFAIAGCSNDLTITAKGSGEPAATANSASFSYTVKGDVGQQEDVLYAANIDAKKGANGGVILNFGHALSQIVFKAKVSNPKLYVEVMGVKVAHVKNSGTFNFSNNTGTSAFDESDDYTADNTNQAGDWTGVTGDATYEIKCTNAVALKDGDNVKDLESDADALISDAMLLMPQQGKMWNELEKGVYFGIKCKIYNVVGATYDASADKQLYGGTEGAYVYVPIAIDWEPGKKYIYTFDFGNGNGGYQPGDDGEPNVDKPILVPVNYAVTVDDFDVVKNGDTPVVGKNEIEGYEPVPFTILYDSDEDGEKEEHKIYIASKNLGAASPSDAGKYFAWGSTTGYTLAELNGSYGQFTQENAPYYSNGEYTKYVNSSNNGIGLTLGEEDDAARAATNGRWRLPTLAEAYALMCIDNEEDTGVNNKYYSAYEAGNPYVGTAGLVIYEDKDGGTPNVFDEAYDKYIFLPNVGTISDGEFNENGGSHYLTVGCWSQQKGEYNLDIYGTSEGDNAYTGMAARYDGLQIRAVLVMDNN